MAGHKIEISGLHQVVFNSAQNRGVVTFTHFRDHDPDGGTAPGAQATREEVRFVVEFLGGGENQTLGFCGHGVGHRGTVQDQRNCGRGKPQVVR